MLSKLHRNTLNIKLRIRNYSYNKGVFYCFPYLNTSWSLTLNLKKLELENGVGRYIPFLLETNLITKFYFLLYLLLSILYNINFVVY